MKQLLYEKDGRIVDTTKTYKRQVLRECIDPGISALIKYTRECGFSLSTRISILSPDFSGIGTLTSHITRKLYFKREIRHDLYATIKVLNELTYTYSDYIKVGGNAAISLEITAIGPDPIILSLNTSYLKDYQVTCTKNIVLKWLITRSRPKS